MKLYWKIIITVAAMVIVVVEMNYIVMGQHDEKLLQLAKLSDNDKIAQKEIANTRLALSKIRPKGQYIVIDTHANKISLRTQDSVYVKADCSTGSGGIFIDTTTGRKWIFDTPRGVFKVQSKAVQPWWRKPDWAFLQENEPIPKNENERYDPEMLGDYALGFGDGFFIHGTVYERLLGVSVTHGCVRVGAGDLEIIYKKTSIGTPVYIF
jgi:lipoprotein-anchoring transpeptidase ErfK/SrfK